MSQTPHDQLAKQYLEEFLTPFGLAQRQYEVPGEAKFVDLWFVPQPAAERPGQDLGLLGQMIQKPCLFEPYRNVPSRTDVRVAVMKLVWVQEDERRKARKAELSEEEQPCLWILAATASQPLLQDANAVTKPGWLPGVYFTADLFKTAIVVIDQLPETDETLWLRVLGRGDTQARSIREVLALPSSHPRRNQILRLVASWRVRMDLGELADFTSQEEPMALSEAFLTWEREKEIQTEMQTKEAIALNMLRKNLDLTTIAEVTGLTISQVEALQTSNS
jgi:hypothetical protein